MATHTSRTNVSPPERFPERPLRQLWQVPTFLAGVVAVLGVYFARPLWLPAEAPSPHVDLAAFRKLVDEPAADVESLVTRGQRLLGQHADTPEHLGEIHYLLGSALVRAAGPAAADKAPALWQQARTHLEQADRLGIASIQQPRLRYRLAQAWLRTGGDKQRVLDSLNQALTQGTENRMEAFSLLTEAHLLPPADLKAALETNARQLSQPTSDELLLAPARLQRGELLVQLKLFAKARAVLENVGRDATPAVTARARLLLVRCYQEEEKWDQAALLGELILSERDQPPAEPGAVAYDLGNAYRRLPGRAAEAERAWQRALTHGGSHAQAAALRLAELYLQEKPREDALPLFLHALQSVTRPEEYVNPFVPLAEVNALLQQACTASLQAGAFPRARELARHLEKTGMVARARTLQGEVAAAWAGALAATDAAQATALFREAGLAYENAVAAGAPAELLLRGMEGFRQARAHADVVRLLETLVRLPEPRERKGEVWFRLGEAREALNQRAAAAAAYAECIQFGGRFEHHARYRLAVFAAATGNADEAIKQLVPNISLLEQVPDETRDRALYVGSLVTLGEQLMRQGHPENYQNALRRFTQALKSNGDNPTAWPIRFQLGECSCLLAHAARTQRDQALNDGVKKVWEEQRLNHLRAAEEVLEKLEHDLLQHRQTTGRLDSPQQKLLDDLGLRLAWARFDQGQYLEALTRYTELADQQRGTLQELIALEGVAWCHRQTGAGDRLGETLQRIRTALETAPETAFTGKSERETRAYWETELPARLLGKSP